MKRARRNLILSMAIFGTLGLFSVLPVSAAVIVMVRAILGTVAVGFLLLCARERPEKDVWKRNAGLLLCSGVCLGLNWMLLFEAYRHTTVAVATLCYYMAPVFLLLLSPIVLKEPMTKRKAVCIATSMLGAVLVSGAAGGGSARGIALGLGAAALYCAIMIMNKRMDGLTPMVTTFAQLLVSAVVITPYALLTVDMELAVLWRWILMCVPIFLMLGFVHTGLAYALYFPAIHVLPSQTVAVLSYIDPIVAVLLSALLLQQPLTGLQILGAVLLLGGTFISEFKQGDT